MKPISVESTLLLTLCGICLAVAVYALAGCAAFQKTVANIGDVTACVLAHDRQTPEEIAVACSGAAVEDIIKILSAERKAQHKAAQRGECSE